jgi:tetratricopeptide (TPR) repeat protein
MINELNREAYLSTMSKGMIDVTESAEPVMDIWPYARLLHTQFTDCAFSILGSMQKLAPGSYLNSYKTSFLTSVSNNFRNYADKFYDEIGYPLDELIDLKAQVQASMKLCKNQPILYNTYYSKRLFLEACIATHSAQSSFDRRVDGAHLNTAKDSLEKAIGLTPFEPLLYKKLGECHSALKSPKAIDVFQKYIQLLPNDAASYNSLGIAFYKNKEYQKAVEQLSVAIKLSPQNAKYLYNLAMGYQALGQDQQAKFYFKKSQSVQPKDLTEY